MITTTTISTKGEKMTQYLGIVTDETIIRVTIFKDFFMGIRSIIKDKSSSYKNILREAKNVVLQEKKQITQNKEVNTMLATVLDYESESKEGSMVVVTASSTAVKFS